MEGYPKVIATVQDFKNLFTHPEYKALAIKELKMLMDFDDRGVTQPTTPKNPSDPNSDYNTIRVVNPYPVHMQKGFPRWSVVVKLYALITGQTVASIMGNYTPAQINAAPVVLT